MTIKFTIDSTRERLTIVCKEKSNKAVLVRGHFRMVKNKKVYVKAHLRKR